MTSINKVIDLLETQPHARERYQDQFRYILVMSIRM
jgi:superfamily I DNA/RNA helicase